MKLKSKQPFGFVHYNNKIINNLVPVDVLVTTTMKNAAKRDMSSDTQLYT